MIIEALESRRLMTTVAVQASLDSAGALSVTGSNNSERIAIVNAVQASGVIGAAGASNFASLLVVTIDGRVVGRFKTRAVKVINVYANGGNDRVTGPDNSIAIRYGAVATGLYSPPARNMLVEGGSGNDRIVGGAGDDVLIGGRGNDVLVDALGSNRLDGGQGNDTLNAVDDGTDVRSLDVGPSPDSLTGGPGSDTFIKDTTDVLTDAGIEDVIK